MSFDWTGKGMDFVIPDFDWLDVSFRLVLVPVSACSGTWRFGSADAPVSLS